MEWNETCLRAQSNAPVGPMQAEFGWRRGDSEWGEGGRREEQGGGRAVWEILSSLGRRVEPGCGC